MGFLEAYFRCGLMLRARPAARRRRDLDTMLERLDAAAWGALMGTRWTS